MAELGPTSPGRKREKFKRGTRRAKKKLCAIGTAVKLQRKKTYYVSEPGAGLRNGWIPKERTDGPDTAADDPQP